MLTNPKLLFIVELEDDMNDWYKIFLTIALVIVAVKTKLRDNELEEQIRQQERKILALENELDYHINYENVSAKNEDVQTRLRILEQHLIKEH